MSARTNSNAFSRQKRTTKLSLYNVPFFTNMKKKRRLIGSAQQRPKRTLQALQHSDMDTDRKKEKEKERQPAHYEQENKEVRRGAAIKISKSHYSDENNSSKESRDEISESNENSESESELEFLPNTTKISRSKFPISPTNDDDCDTLVNEIAPSVSGCFVEYNNRVLQMIRWFNGNESMKANYQKLKDWAVEFEANDAFGMDLTNFMFYVQSTYHYIGGVRTWQLNNPQWLLTPNVSNDIRATLRRFLEMSIEHSPDKNQMLEKVREELGVNDASVVLDETSEVYIKWENIFQRGEHDEILFLDKRRQQEGTLKRDEPIAESSGKEENTNKTKKKTIGKKQWMTRYKSFWQHVINALEELLYENKEECVFCVLRFCELLARYISLNIFFFLSAFEKDATRILNT
ncbi:hypothetical protein RFI_11154 [Reticulomyxa filosa]|uniref:Uncharacterized protein n=1 Tax=Reticulomyxa filosa TaxID=46433 RepID=X6NJ22_RETFI|nr:hypothetical protein RFI_11154 [Reticulomyxa filosa]|eukprot:ETO25986.1 hypothetical protein RFI_11154 [Reticulomyxa filosa]